jgi:5-methylcytosine-specific restriction enzyme subunit McrC
LADVIYLNPEAPVRSVVLTERTPHELPLAQEDLAFLLAQPRFVRVTPAAQPGCYTLTPCGYAGILTTPGCRFVLRPKIPLTCLGHLIDPALVFPHPDASTPEEGLFLDVLAQRFARSLHDLARNGLHRAYRERSEQGPFLRGPLDVAAQMRHATPSVAELHSRHDDFTADLLCNQLLAATAEQLARSPLLSTASRLLLRQVPACFEGVSLVAVTPELWQQAAGALPAAYEPLLEMSRLLHNAVTPGDAGGPTPCPAFLLDLERLFERYVSRALLDACAGQPELRGSAQRTWRLDPEGDGPRLRFRPDVVLSRKQPVAVVDAKWKLLRRGAVSHEDVHQALAYAAVTGTPRVVLVYPGRRSSSWSYDASASGVRLEVRRLRVVGSRDECEGALARFAREMTEAT